LLEVFRHILKRSPDSALLLVGSGEKQNEIMNLARAYDLEPHIHFLGFRTDLWRIFRSMDVLIMPSRVEGFPLTVIQAQLAQVPVLASHAVPPEANFTGNVCYLSLHLPPSVWAEAALELAQKPCRWPAVDSPDVRKFTLEENVRFLCSVYSGRPAQAQGVLGES